MEVSFNFNMLKHFSYFDDSIIINDIKGIVVEFYDLGPVNIEKAKFMAKKCQEHDVLYIAPFIDPWTWMYKNSSIFVDQLLDLLFSHYNLSSDTKIVVTGESMGGLSALVYPIYTTKRIVSCVVNCPVCDLLLHYKEGKDLSPRLVNISKKFESMDQALNFSSPMHLVKYMPKIHYILYHCTNDSKVNMELHTKKFYDLMKENHNIQFYRIPLRDHCSMSDESRIFYISKIFQSF